MSTEQLFQTFLKELWGVFTSVNGSSMIDNIGINICLGMFFSLFLFTVIKMRAVHTMANKHIVALIGAFLLFIRYFIIMIFDWGWKANIYTDTDLHFLFPPIEHYFYMISLGCFAYYSLSHYNYYPGMLKKILWAIPSFMTGFFVYSAVTWKHQYYASEISEVPFKYTSSMIDWQSHSIVAIMALYITIVAIWKYQKNDMFLSGMWTLILINNTLLIASNFCPYLFTWTDSLFKSMQIWIIPILTLHFIKNYVNKLKFCESCAIIMAEKRGTLNEKNCGCNR
jgi:hypothetical protein